MSKRSRIDTASQLSATPPTAPTSTIHVGWPKVKAARASTIRDKDS